MQTANGDTYVWKHQISCSITLIRQSDRNKLFIDIVLNRAKQHFGV